MSVWDDFSANEKLDWLRARLAKLEMAVGALSVHVDEIGAAVKKLEEKQSKK